MSAGWIKTHGAGMGGGRPNPENICHVRLVHIVRHTSLHNKQLKITEQLKREPAIH